MSRGWDGRVRDHVQRGWDGRDRGRGHAEARQLLAGDGLHVNVERGVNAANENIAANERDGGAEYGGVGEELLGGWSASAKTRRETRTETPRETGRRRTRANRDSR